MIFACALCKEVVAAVQSHLAEGYFWSVLFMLSMPVVVVTCVTWGIVRATRRRRL